MDPKAPITRKLRFAGFWAASAVALLAIAGLASASGSSSSTKAGSSVLTMESSPESAITQNFNPYVQ